MNCRKISVETLKLSTYYNLTESSICCSDSQHWAKSSMLGVESYDKMSESAQLSGGGSEASQGFMVTDSSTAESSGKVKPKGRGTVCVWGMISTLSSLHFSIFPLSLSSRMSDEFFDQITKSTTDWHNRKMFCFFLSRRLVGEIYFLIF